MLVSRISSNLNNDIYDSIPNFREFREFKMARKELLEGSAKLCLASLQRFQQLTTLWNPPLGQTEVLTRMTGTSEMKWYSFAKIDKLWTCIICCMCISKYFYY